MNLPSYPKVLALGHRYISDIFSGSWLVEEKIDGSQLSFGMVNGELCMRSKGCELYRDNPNKMFAKAVQFIVSVENRLQPGFVYRGEYLCSPKHNTLCYERVPKNNIIIFDIEDVNGNPVADPVLKRYFADNIDLECVPAIALNMPTAENLKALLDIDSCLGGQKIEGVVVKNYGKISLLDGKFLVGKFVSEAFKERHKREWKATNPGTGSIIQQIIDSLKTDARYRKAVQHLKENGTHTGTPADIGNLLKEIHTDIAEEEADFIKDKLYAHFINNIKRGVCGGFPEWYKELLMTEGFNERDKERECLKSNGRMEAK